MAGSRLRRPRPVGAPEIESVEWLPSDVGKVLVRVAGRWPAASPRTAGEPVLVVDDGARAHRFPALPATSQAVARAAGERDSFRASFLVAQELTDHLGRPATLEIGGESLALPAARERGAPGSDPPQATVIDRAVLAERRARRAEIAEEANARRAADAEQAIATLESELARLESRLEESGAERIELERLLTDRDRSDAHARDLAREPDAAARRLATMRRELALSRTRAPASSPPAHARAPAVDGAILAFERRMRDARQARPVAEAAVRARVVREVLSSADAALGAAERSLSQVHAAAARVQLQLEPDQEREPPAPEPPQPTPTRPWLPDALRALVAEDPRAGAALLVELLPAQGADGSSELDYDLDLASFGCYRVTFGDGRSDVVYLHEPRSRRLVDFRLRTDPATAIEILTRGGAVLPRRAPVKARATFRRKRKCLRRLAPAGLGLAELADRGIWVDPGLVYRALTLAIPPEWTAGQRFCLAHEVTGAAGGPWYLNAGDGERLRVGTSPPSGPPDASVRTSPAAFQRLLGGRRPEAGDKAVIRGDVGAVYALSGWVERIQGIAS